MMDLISGIAAHLRVKSDFNRLKDADPQCSIVRVMALVDVLEKHYTASFRRNPIAVQMQNESVMAEALDNLMQEGRLGQQAVLNFCERNEYTLPYEVLRASFASGNDLSGVEAFKDPSFVPFVDKLIAGHDCEDPISYNVPRYHEREHQYSRLRECVKQLAGGNTDGVNLPTADL